MKNSESDSMVSRRSFLGSAAAGVAAGALGGVSAASAQGSVAAEMRTDVVVAGSGIGGMTTALRAQKAGARVIVLEKAYEPGGTTAHSEGGVWTAETWDDIRNDAPAGDPEVQRTLFDTLPEVYKFYESIGAPLGAARPNVTRSRSIPPVAFINFMVAEFERNKGTLLVDTPLLRLLVNNLYEVIGVLAEGPKGPVRILAKAVVLATGGWAGNAQLVTAHITRHFGALHQRNAGFGGRKPALTGDGLLAAMQIGAAPSTGAWDAFYGHTLPAKPTKKFANPLADYSLYHGPWGIAVNLYGRRFADETYGKIAGRKLGRGAGEHIINQEEAQQPEACAAFIWDESVNIKRACADCGLGDLDKFVAYRDIGAPTATANTLLDLAQQMEKWNRGISAEAVYQELTEYNQAAKNGKAWALRIPKLNSEQALPIETPPFYAMAGQTGITITHGGLRVNSQGQVLSRTERPIRGLYAAGVDIGNFSNYVYLGGLSMGAAYGYISGANAAKEPPPRGGWQISSFV